MALYIKRITTNVKNARGASQSWELSPKTLIVGPNEAGKSAIAQSAQIIAEGGAAGLLFRKGLVKLPAQLASLAPHGQGLSIEAELSNGGVVRFVAEPGHKPKIEGERHIGIGVEAVRAAFSGSADTARRFLATNCVWADMPQEVLASTTKADFYKSVPPTYKPKLQQLWGDTEVGTVTFEDLYGLLDAIDEQRKAASKAVDAGNLTIQALGVGIVPGSTGLLNEYAERLRISTLADFFRTTGPAAKAQSDDGNPKPLEAVRWLASEIGGKAVLAGAAPFKTATQDFVNLAGNVYVEKLADITRARVAEATAEMNAWENFYELVHDYTTTLIDTRLLPEFQRRVTKHLPPGDTFVLSPKSLFPGLMRNGRVHVALSGSAEARVLAAMTASFAAPDKLNLLVVDDRMWDSGNLGRTLRALGDAECQVLVMSTLAPRGRPRSGWQVIELEARYDADDGDDMPYPE